MALRGLLALIFTLICAAAFAQTPPPAPAAPATGPAKVTIGIYVNDITSVDLPRHTFAGDIYVWFRWSDPAFDPTVDPALDPVHSFELMNAVNLDDLKTDALYDAPLKQNETRQLYQLARVQGTFSAKFDVARYPFDVQTLRIEIEDADKGSDELVYVVDTVAINPELTLPGYAFGKATLEVRDKPYGTAFGDLEESTVGGYSRATLELPIARPPVSGALKKLLPVVLIMLCAVSALLLAARHVDAQIGLTITALLALVALQFNMAGDLPEVGYLLMLDQIYIASYAFILVLIAIIVLRSRSDDAGEQRRLGGFGAATASLALYAAAFAAILWFNLRG
jgi:hypothetical protein